jgi:hypothetical protein
MFMLSITWIYICFVSPNATNFFSVSCVSPCNTCICVYQMLMKIVLTSVRWRFVYVDKLGSSTWYTVIKYSRYMFAIGWSRLCLVDCYEGLSLHSRSWLICRAVLIVTAFLLNVHVVIAAVTSKLLIASLEVCRYYVPSPCTTQVIVSSSSFLKLLPLSVCSSLTACYWVKRIIRVSRSKNVSIIHSFVLSVIM